MSVGHDEIVTRKRCVWFVCVLVINVIKVVKDVVHFHFLSPVVTEFERVNAFFQATYTEANEMVKKLNLYYNSLSGRVYDSSGVPLPADKVDYGAKFVFEAAALLRSEKNDENTARRVRETYSRCNSMLLEAAIQCF